MDQANRPSLPPRPGSQPPKVAPPRPAASTPSPPKASTGLEGMGLVDENASGTAAFSSAPTPSAKASSAPAPVSNRPTPSARPQVEEDEFALEPDYEEEKKFKTVAPEEISFADDFEEAVEMHDHPEKISGQERTTRNKTTGDGIQSLDDDEIGDHVELLNDDEKQRLTMNELLIDLMKRDGSDLILSANARPAMRIRGDIEQIQDYPVLSGDDIQEIVYGIMSADQKATYEDHWELDFAHAIQGYARFRVNVLRQKKQVGAVLRVIPFEIKSTEELGLPEAVKKFAFYPRGLVLVTGPTGSGKSTTLAAIVDLINRERKAHVVTIEDPVEFVHEHKLSIINQREINEDTKSFAEALKHVLRQDPDVILLGEMRDLETISTAITAAETGHLVFGTLHTQSAKETISRVIDVFPEGGKAQVRTQLAAGLRAVVCQTLLKKKGGGRVAALEIMVATDAIKNLVREDKLHQIPSSMETSKGEGMQTLEECLLDLVGAGKVDAYDAAEKAPNRDKFIQKLGGAEGIKKMEQRRANGIGMGKLG